MNKTVKKVFLLIGLLVLIFMIWFFVLGGNGVVVTVLNGMIDGLNTQIEKVSSKGNLIPSFGEDTGGGSADSFDIDGGTP